MSVGPGIRTGKELVKRVTSLVRAGQRGAADDLVRKNQKLLQDPTTRQNLEQTGLASPDSIVFAEQVNPGQRARPSARNAEVQDATFIEGALPGAVKPTSRAAKMGALLAGGGGLGAGGYLALSEDPEAAKDAFFSGLAAQVPPESAPATDESSDDDSNENTEPTVDLPAYTRGGALRDTSAEEASLRSASETAIRDEKAKALKGIRTKEALSKLIDAIALGAGASYGVEAPIQLGDSIDTSLDKELLRDMVSSRRAELRDKLRELRGKAREEYAASQREAARRADYDWKKYRAQTDRMQQLAKDVLTEKQAREKEEKDLAKAAKKQREFNRKAQEAITRRADKISRSVERAWKAYQKDGDEDGFLESLEAANIPLTDEDKAMLVDRGTLFDDAVRPDSQWIRRKAREDFGEMLKGQFLKQSGTDSKPAPYGETVAQDNKIYRWNGQEYIEE